MSNDREDEYSQCRPEDEFYKDGREYFAEQADTETKAEKKSNKKKIGKISKMVVSTVCIAVTAASVQIINPIAETVVHTSATEPVETDIPNQTEDIEVIDEMTEADIEAESEELLLSPSQKAYISNVWEAFENDDFDRLSELIQDESGIELSSGDFKGKVFLPDEDRAYDRDGFNGVGILLHKGTEKARRMYKVTLVDGAAEGEGQNFVYAESHFPDETGFSNRYYSGMWVQNNANGEGRVQCSHDHWIDAEYEKSHRIQHDSGQGVFRDGWLVDGSMSFSWEESGTRVSDGESEEYSERTRMETTAENGMYVFVRTYRTDLLTGAEDVFEQEDDGPSDHIRVVGLR